MLSGLVCAPQIAFCGSYGNSLAGRGRHTISNDERGNDARPVSWCCAASIEAAAARWRASSEQSSIVPRFRVSLRQGSHTAPVRLELHERPIGDEVARLVSFNNGPLQGHWTFSEGAEGEPAFFEVHFNARPDRPLKEHRFVQIHDTIVYRHIAEVAEYSVILIYVQEASW